METNQELEEIKAPDPTIQEWIEKTLPPDLQEKVHHNIKHHGICRTERDIKELLETPRRSFWHAIASSFILGNTDEGYEFWKGILEQYDENLRES